MSTASLDRILAILVAAAVATGALTLRSGSPDAAWVYVSHGLVASALLWAVGLKLRRSMPTAVRARRWGRLVVGLGVAFVTLAALIGGFAWVGSGRLLDAGPWTVLTLHAWAGLALAPIVALHLVPRRWRLLRPGRRAIEASTRRLLSRRAFVAGALVLVSAGSTYVAADALDRARGGVRRFTGSRWLPSGGIPPATTFLGDGVPSIDPAAWRLRVHGRVLWPASYSLEELRSLGETDLAAVLDCTSGWAIETAWRGIPVARLLALAGPVAEAARVDVRSSTGWGASFDLCEIRATLLATAVAGQALPAAGGAPCRLVVPDRRGLDWVKWVTEIEVS